MCSLQADSCRKDTTLPYTDETVLAPPLQAQWSDWKWQQRNAIRTVQQLLDAFPGLNSDVSEAVQRNLEHRRFQITPYTLNLIRRSPAGDRPASDDPMWRQVVPYWSEDQNSDYAYDAQTDNWELPNEMVTPIAQHKYDNRIIIRLANVCLAYCQFCYEALRTLEKDSPKLSFQDRHWGDTLAYLRRTPKVEEVILSGGEPLMLQDEQLDRVLCDLNGLGRPMLIRIHTRALTFNPFRITPELCALLAGHKIVAVGLHVTHPNEITSDFLAAVDRLHQAVPILFANMPLLKGVNDSVEMMHHLGMKLYSCGVIPQYLYHFMPFSPGGAEFRTTVQAGIDIVRSLKRRVSNMAVPEFVMPHSTGKYSPPLLHINEAAPVRTIDDSGHAVIRYSNWLGETVNYPDGYQNGSGKNPAIVRAQEVPAVLDSEATALPILVMPGMPGERP
jgi:lysine 2,3-aminomutase